MKNFSFLLATLALTSLAYVGRAQSVGVGTSSPDGNAALDISAGPGNNKGLLIPRMTASQRAKVTSSTEGMLVYQTDGTQPGFWYYTGGTWVPLPSGVASSAGWLRTGNSGTDAGTYTGVGNDTNAGTSFLGTTDQQDLVFRTGNTERLRITTGGSLYSRSAYGLILNGSDAPMLTRGWDTFQSGAYKGLGRWGLFMRASQLASGIPNLGGKTFGWVTYNDDSSVGATLMTLTQDGNLGLGLNGTAATTRLSISGAGTGNPNTTATTQTAGQIVRLRDNGNVALDLGSSGSAGGMWLQATNPTDLSTNYALRLNPNGGNVGIGTGTAAPTSTLSVGGTLSVAVSTAIAGGGSSGTLLGTYSASYLGLSPADNTSNNYLLPDPTTCPGRIYYIRNSTANNASLSTVGYAAGSRELFSGNGTTGFQTYNLGGSNGVRTIICLSDGTNWIISQLN